MLPLRASYASFGPRATIPTVFGRLGSTAPSRPRTVNLAVSPAFCVSSTIPERGTRTSLACEKGGRRQSAPS
jgi:hypothetical protein